ncbi:hypothetical protein [Bacillus sp. FJAT-27986]|uniref:hypothetical protein n=1 Tax=Bacillus sp. FJAT-27986 TaxID=1743146 RepID=UPI00080AE929|nr:hypothetical protein [Bacillus sp. FJAT-27986]OCA86165.1 hypothetical protein A8L44_07045 [Bacillus sp. FJAT-27986]
MIKSPKLTNNGLKAKIELTWRDMIRIGEFFMIKDFYQKGWTITAIAKETDFDRKTIKKYIEQSELPNYQKRKTGNNRKKIVHLFIFFIHLSSTVILDCLLHRNKILTFNEEQNSIRIKYRRALFEEQSVES